MKIAYIFIPLLMLKALFSITTSIPDSFNNCSTYFYKDSHLTPTLQSLRVIALN